MRCYDVVIIGGGPAGIAVSLQLKRYDLKAILFEQEELGGLLRNAHLVENYPGFPKGISGKNLVALFTQQIKHAQIPICYEAVIKLDYKKGIFLSHTSKQVASSHMVVVATGTKPNRFPDDMIQEKIQHEIYYDIHTIDNIQKKTIIIIGSGDAAFDYALHFSKNNTVHILNRSEQTKCLPLLFTRCTQKKHITYHKNITPLSIQHINNKKKVLCIDTNTKETMTLTGDYVIGAIGRTPNLDCISEHVSNQLHKLTNEKKIYIIGDANHAHHRQIGISIGDGIKTAMTIQDILKREPT